MTKLMVMESYFTQMVISMKENGWMIKLMAKANTFTIMVPFMRANG